MPAIEDEECKDITHNEAIIVYSFILTILLEQVQHGCYKSNNRTSSKLHLVS